MLYDILQKLFTRDLNKLKAEIELYHEEKNIWKTEGAIANSAGNLCLHLVGNLNTLSSHFTYHPGQVNYHRRMPDA